MKSYFKVKKKKYLYKTRYIIESLPPKYQVKMRVDPSKYKTGEALTGLPLFDRHTQGYD